ncbi:MAG: lipoate--protein ligase family protein [Gemmatimonadetes bacterium]|nr:lipoate--protein ligase family protein [Gemmatimonadota bacterium]
MSRPIWRLLDTLPAPGAWNMAVDEALLASVREGGLPTLRFYRWSPACLSLGRNQPARDRYNLEAIQTRGLDVVRRPTGGRAVMHDRELTYSLAVPDGLLGSPRATYAAVNRALAAGLRRLGVPAELAPRGGGRVPAPSLAPCFKEPVEGEIVAGGRKLVGSAQYRKDGVVLQHGSLLLDGDQEEVRSLLREPEREARSVPPATLAMYRNPLPSWEALTHALAAGWEETSGVVLCQNQLSPGEQLCARRLAERYHAPAWTWHH